MVRNLSLSQGRQTPSVRMCMGLSRREVLKAGAAAATAAATPAWASARPRPGARVRRPGAGRRVAVLGGGMAGLAAAHELAERGFRVDVYERKALGGKARSIPVAGTAAGGRKPLPGEHGFRFFPGFYHHVPDSMRRTPFPGNQNGVWDNLVEATAGLSLRTRGRPEFPGFGGLVYPSPPAPAPAAAAGAGRSEERRVGR